jgi:hypothetical protein
MSLVISNNTFSTTDNGDFTGGVAVFNFGGANDPNCIAFFGNSVTTTAGDDTPFYFDGNFGPLGGGSMLFESDGAGLVPSEAFIDSHTFLGNPRTNTTSPNGLSVFNALTRSNGVACRRPGDAGA